MQDFDTLRDRVEETAQKLTSAQDERQQQTETLIGILRQLEDKYDAQQQQLAYYKERVEPLEEANEQLSFLLGNLLDLIDGGFGEDSLMPMRKASEMATAMLATDMAQVSPEPSAEPEADQPVAEDRETEEPFMETASEMAFEPDAETDAAPVGLTPDQVLDLIEDQAEPEDTDALAGEATEFPSVSLDFEMEEEALAKLEEDVEPAAEDLVGAPEMTDSPAETTGIPVEMAHDDVAFAGDAIEVPAQEGPITVDEIVSDAEMREFAESDFSQTAAFEDVTAATLELELEEDAAAGMDDLPEVVQIAAAAARNPEPEGDTELAASVEMTAEQGLDFSDLEAADSGAALATMEADADVESAAEEAEAIAAIAEAIEAESKAENATPPAPADIRSLLLRVEALAKKAEAMRMAQDGTGGTAPAAEKTAESEKAGDPAGQKKTDTAA